jgi:hypothetical protein
MGFRFVLFLIGVLATGLSFFVGLWSAWVGIPLMFIAAVLYFIDKE